MDMITQIKEHKSRTNNRRAFSRMNVKIYGTLFKDGIEIPIIIVNISENGIGIRYKYRDCPANFHVKKGDTFSLQFFDDNSFGNNIQSCVFKIAQVRSHTTHSYIGAKLIEDEYNYMQYVRNKKITQFVAAIKFSGLAMGM